MDRHMSFYVDIVGLLVSDSLSGRQIALALGVSPQFCLYRLNELVHMNVIYAKVKGRSKLYFLSHTYQAKVYVCLYEMSKSLQCSAELQLIVSELMPLCRTIIVYGSFAKGTYHKDSDIDMVVLDAHSALKKMVEKYPRKISLECLSFEEFVAHKSYVMNEIKQHHLLFGDVFGVVDKLVFE